MHKMAAIESPTVTVSTQEVIDIAADDALFYCSHFFPKAFRQKFAPFHKDIFDLLESGARHVGLEIFRGGAKTTFLRAFCSRRIAYGISNTIFFVSEAQDHSIRSIRWLKKAIMFNKQWANTYGLRKGDKWTDEFIEIIHEPLGITISVIAMGITGQTRGVNIDDYRPDLIVVDDPCDEENSATEDQRKKIENLFFGALEKSLAPVSENPSALMALLQTSLDSEDVINICHKDASWHTMKISCFTEANESAWPARWTTETLVEDKAGHVDRNQLSLWLREMECTITDPETCMFRQEWLEYYDVYPDTLAILGGIDPVPPPKDGNKKHATEKDTDFEVLGIAGTDGKNFYILDYELSRGHEPDWTIAKFFMFHKKWRPLRWLLDAVAYQRTLKWILTQSMKKQKVYPVITEIDDKRSKRLIIQQGFTEIASSGRLFVRRDMQEFIDQFTAYPNCTHDDILDAFARVLRDLELLAPELESGLSLTEEEEHLQIGMNAP